EYARGRLNAAVQSWSKVPPRSPQAGLAQYYRARIAVQQGQFTEAERLLVGSLSSRGLHADDARWELVKLLRVEGRFDEAGRIFVRAISPGSDLPGMLRMLYTLDVNPVPVESLRQSLELASRQAPDDDRVWLARGHLALIQGDLDEADRWLSDCEGRRPQDM